MKRKHTPQQKLSDTTLDAWLAFSPLHDTEVVRGSGNQDQHPGDAKGSLEGSYDFLVEHKATEKGSYALSLRTLQKIDRESSEIGRHPALGVSFRNPETGKVAHYVVLPLELWEADRKDQSG